MNDSILQSFKEMLLTMKNDIEARFDMNNHFNLEQSLAQQSVSELSNYDNHPGDLGTELYEREKDIALNEHTEDEYKDILHALKRIEDGTYGKCIVCHNSIPIERLEALPTTPFCIEHTPSVSISKDRPIEEEVLTPPFERHSNDGKDATFFDSEDSFQAVARFGTSETPADFTEPRKMDYDDLYDDPKESIGYIEDIVIDNDDE